MDLSCVHRNGIGYGREAKRGFQLGLEVIEQFILAQLDRTGLGHNTFTMEALALIVRSGEGLYAVPANFV